MASLQDQALATLEFLFTPSPTVFVLGFLVVVLVPVFLHLYLTRSVAYITLPSILVAGPAGAGKTALATRLERQGPKPADTYTSQKINVVELAVGEDAAASQYTDDLDSSGAVAKKFLLVDTPGHGKLRNATALARLDPASTKAHKLQGVVYMVDSAALGEEAGSDSDAGLAGAAAYLYDLLLLLQKRMGAGNSSKAPHTIPLLIAANKADLFTALPAPLVKAQLEAELSRIRTTRSKGLLDSGVGVDDVDAGAAGAEDDDWLGEYGSKSFKFDQMREFDIDVDVIAGNVVGSDGPGVGKWWTWIAQQI
ncbi:srp receptor beta subunit [Ophiostoma piceae UAMH 11346]|uniref:Signal recognition particle receptor subunit beta n=1 Tax=Ophiostoma piceae (strain UAMH 11346) TaxID=1262450 RepID=S3BXX8_OPHP1|nr:srp receptor beta subunit [Ophiostoma piceae UAMH 11346]